MSKYLHCGEWNKNNKYIFLTAFFAILTYCNYGYIFSDYLDEFNIKDNNHIIINHTFCYVGLIIFSASLYKYESWIIGDYPEENDENKIIISPMFILIIMIIMVVQEISEDIFYKSKLRALDFWMLELPLLSYLNLKYFKFRIYLHHKLVIYLILIVCSIENLIKLIIFTKDRNEDLVFNYYKENRRVIPLGILSYLIIMISRAFALSD